MMKSVMSSRDRVRSALQRKCTGKIPIDFGGRVSSLGLNVYRELRKTLGLPVDDRPVYDHHYQRLGIAEVAEDLLAYLKTDTRYIHFVPSKSLDTSPKKKADGSFYYHDEWGVGLRRSPNTFYFDFDYAPLSNATVDDLKQWKWPVMDDSRNAEWEKKIEDYRDGNFAIVTVFKGLFEQSWPLRGFEQLFIDMVQVPDFVRYLFDSVLDSQKKIYGKFFDVVGPSLDITLFTEDMCGQKNPLFSPDFYRKEVKPRHLELVDFIKSKCPNAYVGIHSDGAVSPFIQDFIDIGIECLNPLQTTAKGMEAGRIGDTFGESISFWAGVDTQHLLPSESVQTVEKEVEKLVRTLAAGNGYLFAPAHNILDDTHPDNVLAMFRAIEKVNSCLLP